MKKFTLLSAILLCIVWVCNGQWTYTSLSEQTLINVPGDYPTIQQGIDAANPGDTVLVADGLYYEQISFLGKKPLMVVSLFLTTGDTNHINNTILDGSQLLDMDNASVVLFASGEDTTSILCGFTVRGGKGTHVESSNDRAGGGIYISDSGAKIIHNKITGNTLDDTQPVNGTGVYGGGVGTRKADGDFWVVIENNRIYNNSVITKNDYSAGGGIYTSYHARIAYNDIFENTSTCVSGGWAVGGGISHLGSGATNTVIINHNKIHNNIAQSATGVGTDGGVSSQYAHMVFTNNEVTANSGITSAIMGGVGGISVIDPAKDCIVSGNIFRENISTNVGGGMHLENTTDTDYPNLVVISDNFFLDNEADEGGAVSDNDIPIIFQNNVCKGNHTINRGGALRLFNYIGDTVHHMAILINNSFAGNTTANFGGAVYSNRAMPLIFNCVFYNDEAGQDGPEIYLNHYLDTLDLANCNIDPQFIHGSVYDGGGNFNEDPMFADPELLTLSDESPCLEAGTASYICHCGHLNLCPGSDIDGYGRPQGSLVDIGAYEYLYVGIGEPPVVSRESLVVSYPNPFSSVTTIEYALGEAGMVTLKIFNYSGQEITAPVNEQQSAGRHQVQWNAEGWPAGVYFYQLRAEGIGLREVGKLVVK